MTTLSKEQRKEMINEIVEEVRWKYDGVSDKELKESYLGTISDELPKQENLPLLCVADSCENLQEADGEFCTSCFNKSHEIGKIREKKIKKRKGQQITR